MSDALEKAKAAVTAAEDNTDVVRLALAAVELARAAQEQQAAVPPQPCQHHQQQPFDARKWLVIGGVTCVCGCVAAVLAIAFAAAMTALAIGGTCATACLLVLRSMWRDHQRGK